MLFEEQTSRKPNLYPQAQRFISALWASHWTPNEFNFLSDRQQYLNALNAQQRLVIVRTLSCIGQIEIAVKKFWGQLGDKIRHPIFSDLGFVIAANEVIHNHAYEKLLDVLDMGHEFENNMKEPVIRDRVHYLKKYLDPVYTSDQKQFIYSIILFSLFVEHVSLFSQFFIVMNFNRYKNVLKDTAQQVQYTRNEEFLHAQIGFFIIRQLRQEYPSLFDKDLEARVMDETIVANTCETNVLRWILQDYNDHGLNYDIVRDYIHLRINSGLDQIGFKSSLGPVPEKNQKHFLWMEEETKGYVGTDFFHKRPVQYGKGPDMSGIF